MYAFVTLVMLHVVEPLIALKEIHRTLKPGGMLLIIDLQPHTVEMFKQQMGHRWMGFELQAAQHLAGRGGLQRNVPARLSPSREDQRERHRCADLFVVRAIAANDRSIDRLFFRKETMTLKYDVKDIGLAAEGKKRDRMGRQGHACVCWRFASVSQRKPLKGYRMSRVPAHHHRDRQSVARATGRRRGDCCLRVQSPFHAR